MFGIFMYKELLKGKIHRAVMAEADLHYEGSITIDSNLLTLAAFKFMKKYWLVPLK